MLIKAPKYILIFILFVAIAGCKSDEGDNVADFKIENRKALGTSGADILADDFYKSMVVELVYSEGFRPEQTTLDSFMDFLTERVNKPEGITFIEKIIEAPTGAPFTTQEIRQIEDQNRTRYTEDDTIAIYVFFANGRKDTDTPISVTLGTAYQNTSIVIYESTIRTVSISQDIDLALLESNTLFHEFGHIFGLTNILDDDIHTNHEDPGSNRHCIVESCLMYFQSNLGKNSEQLLSKLRGRQAVPTFDELCLEDLRAKGGK